MSQFFEDTMQGLLEAVEIEKGNIPLKEKRDMPALTFMVVERERELIDEMVSIRKGRNISQKKLASITGNRQQAISRIEKKENSPSLKSFLNIIYAMGYDIEIVPRKIK